MYYIILTLIYITTQVNSYVLLQVRRDDQNRSNVDALIHKVVPPGHFDRIAQNIARKHFLTAKPEKKIEPAEQTLEESDSMAEDDKIKDVLQEILEKKPMFRSKDISISMYWYKDIVVVIFAVALS